ncbi:FIST N-terminal domain-containing protein [Methylobacillus sp. Pita2]|uniref:FIST N-terminal domain-containing protein n=1 Tax=Methylobacillus sp. Pita2 TaxID=3383245 RepID=UPI0038B675D4
MKVGTGLAQGRQPLPELAAQAVRQALDQAGLDIATGVLLFLSEDFAQDPQPALRTAATAASTTQVSGCSAPGIFTQDEWVLDGSAAAALVLGDGAAIAMARDQKDGVLLTLTAPNAFNASWMESPGIRFGGVAGDATGQGQFSLWGNGKVLTGHCDLALEGAAGVVDVAHPFKPIGVSQRIDQASGHDLLVLSNQSASRQSAWSSLANALSAQGIEHQAGIPCHHMMLMLAESEAALSRGDCQLIPIVGANADTQSVTLAKEAVPGDWLAWGVLDRDAAQRHLASKIASMGARLRNEPTFGLMFSCLARGPHFYDGVDHDLALLKRYYPGMPVIGFYGNGEIAPVNGRNALWQHSVVLGLFTAES